jgi:hypothetical protein
MVSVPVPASETLPLITKSVKLPPEGHVDVLAVRNGAHQVRNGVVINLVIPRISQTVQCRGLSAYRVDHARSRGG